MSDFRITGLTVKFSYTTLKFLTALILCWLLLSAAAAAQVSVSGWTPPKKAESKKALPISELAAKGEAPPSRKAENANLVNIREARLHRLPAPRAEELSPKTDKKRVRVGVNRTLPAPLGAPSDFTFYEFVQQLSESAMESRRNRIGFVGFGNLDRQRGRSQAGWNAAGRRIGLRQSFG